MGSGRRAFILIEGKTFREISDMTGMREATLRARYAPGCTIADLLAKKSLRIGGKTISEIARETGLTKTALYKRYYSGRTDLAQLAAEKYSRKK